MNKSPKSQLPVPRRPSRLNTPLERSKRDTIGETRILMVHHYNCAPIILAVAVLIRAVGGGLGMETLH
jgi:hypothetical protein